MKLSTWLAHEGLIILQDVDVTGITHDSRKVQPGDAFLAYPGATVDGRQYIDQALARGACVVLYDDSQDFIPPEHDCSFIACPHLAERLGRLSSTFYDHPSKKLRVIGITGTNGKTTIAYQLTQALNLLGERACYLGTLGFGEPAHLQAGVNTTPDGLQLQTLLYQAVQAGVRWVVMEVSSHALAEGRVDGVCFEQAIFTNLTRDHLDYHQTMEHYAAAKAKLFAWASLKAVILNCDDPYAQQMLESVHRTQVQVLGYSVHQEGHHLSVDDLIYADSIEFYPTETHCTVHHGQARCPMKFFSLGSYNVANMLALLSSLVQLGHSLASLQTLLPQLKSAPGRLELVSHQPLTMVDFAHTPDALNNVLTTLNAVKRGRLIVVFGCGGDRDPGKRPQMGAVASQLADVIILTSDNPRSEDPELIIQEICRGIERDRSYRIIVDRAQAIQEAMAMAGPDDMVLIAGKGHETYQHIGAVKHHFSDHEEILKYLTQWSS